MISPRACWSPTLLGPLWCPVFSGSAIHRTRASPAAATTCAESSVQPSPMTSSSKSVNVCRSTLAIAYRRTPLQLYVGRMTVTCGFTRTAYFLSRRSANCAALTLEWHDARIEDDRMNREPQHLVERRDRGVIRHAGSVYGASLDGIPLTVYLPETGSAEIVVLASIHGDEAETTVVVSEALRCLPRGDLKAAVILCANPDGILRGTRGNGRGVDLNRNFPTSNWSPDAVCY